MNTIDTTAIKEFETEYKLALTSTIDEESYPHLTLINTLSAKNEKELVSGEFIKGLSKEYMKIRNKVGFIIMSFAKDWWTGTAQWTESQNSGDDYERMNRIPMFRYNTYLGIHTVHYYDLNDITERRKLDMAGIISNALVNVLVKPFLGMRKSEKALNKWSYDLFKSIGTLKFISFIDSEGYPRVYPIVQAQACSRGRIVIPLRPYKKELSEIADGAKAAIMCANMDMDSVMVKGAFHRKGGAFAYLDIERVYNTLPPKQGPIYP